MDIKCIKYMDDSKKTHYLLKRDITSLDRKDLKLTSWRRYSFTY